MPGRVQALLSDPPAFVLRHLPNWTAIVCFGSLAVIHLVFASTILAPHEWESLLSAGFGLIFGLVTLFHLVFCRTIAIFPHRQEIRLAWFLGPLSCQRFVPFSQVTAVRVTLTCSGSTSESCVTIVCDDREVDLPPTSTPRQEALALAILMHVHLIKVYADGVVPITNRIDKLMGHDETVV